MAYTKTTIPNLAEGEQGYELDDGTLVAAHAELERHPVLQQLSCRVRVRVVSKKGKPVLDPHGTPIETAHSRSLKHMGFIDHVGGPMNLVKQTLEIALGEESAEVLVNDHIRHALKATQLAATHVDLSKLN